MASQQQSQVNFRAVLGTEASSAEYDINCQDFGVVQGVKYDCVSIFPANEGENFDTKQLQVTYKTDEQIRDNMKYATVSVNETPSAVTDDSTISKMITLRSADKEDELSAAAGMTDRQIQGESEQEIFASDPEALKYFQFASQASDKKHMESRGAKRNEDSEPEIYASDAEASKYFKFVSQHQKTERGKGESEVATNESEPQEVFASDPEALKFIKLKPIEPTKQKTEEESEIFASDEEALKFIKLSPFPINSAQSSNFAQARGNDVQNNSPKTKQLGSIAPAEATTSNADDLPEIFASDDEALRLIKFSFQSTGSNGNNWNANQDVETACTPPSSPTVELNSGLAVHSCIPADSNERHFGSGNVAAAEDSADSSLLAEAKVTLIDNKDYNVRVTGTDLPNGLQKKVVSVSGNSGQTLSAAEVERLQVNVEETINSDGTVQKFVSIE